MHMKEVIQEEGNALGVYLDCLKSMKIDYKQTNRQTLIISYSKAFAKLKNYYLEFYL